MSVQKIRWYISYYIYKINIIDLLTIFSTLLLCFTYTFVFPQYEKNINSIIAENLLLQNSIKKDLIVQNNSQEPIKNLLNANIAELTKTYQYMNVNVASARYDSQSKQISLQLQGTISKLTLATKTLESYNNIHLVSFSLVQNDLKKQPTLNIIWQIQD